MQLFSVLFAILLSALPFGMMSCTPTTSVLPPRLAKCQGTQFSYPLGSDCALGKGLCLRSGKWKCLKRKDKFILVCDAEKGLPTQERCNGKDDDCDGRIDESLKQSCFDALPVKRNVGRCRSGRSVCTNGQWSSCKGQRLPMAETCNGKDDDCDGRIDKKLSRSCYLGEKSTENTGVCHSGTQACVSGTWEDCQGSIYPKQGESCLPILKHTIVKSLLTCEAKAQSQACVPKTGACQILGSMKTEKTRKTDDATLIRCRGSSYKDMGCVHIRRGVSKRIGRSPKEKRISPDCCRFCRSLCLQQLVSIRLLRSRMLFDLQYHKKALFGLCNISWIPPI